MSWSVSATIAAGSNVRAELDAAAERWQNMNQGAEPEALAQVNQAIEAAVAVIGAGVIGSYADYAVQVSLSGHANPGHAPRAGWANDGVHVSVTQA